jgi:hypothetical protein
MARSTCARCDHELTPGAGKCPRCGALHLTGGRRITVGRRARGGATGKRIRRAILIVLALAFVVWLLYLEWPDLPARDAPQTAPPSAPASQAEIR